MTINIEMSIVPWNINNVLDRTTFAHGFTLFSIMDVSIEKSTSSSFCPLAWSYSARNNRSCHRKYASKIQNKTRGKKASNTKYNLLLTAAKVKNAEIKITLQPLSKKEFLDKRFIIF